MTRDAAVEGAMKSIDSMRAASDETILSSVTAIEAIVYAPHSANRLSAAEMGTILRYADQIVTLAGTFGYQSLDMATRSLCDITDGLLGTGIDHIAPIAVHVQAIRLMAPGGPSLSGAETAKVLDELAKILTHFELSSISTKHAGQDIAVAVIAEGH